MLVKLVCNRERRHPIMNNTIANACMINTHKLHLLNGGGACIDRYIK